MVLQNIQKNVRSFREVGPLEMAKGMGVSEWAKGALILVGIAALAKWRERSWKVSLVYGTAFASSFWLLRNQVDRSLTRELAQIDGAEIVRRTRPGSLGAYAIRNGSSRVVNDFLERVSEEAPHRLTAFKEVLYRPDGAEFASHFNKATMTLGLPDFRRLVDLLQVRPLAKVTPAADATIGYRPSMGKEVVEALCLGHQGEYTFAQKTLIIASLDEDDPVCADLLASLPDDWQGTSHSMIRELVALTTGELGEEFAPKELTADLLMAYCRFVRRFREIVGDTALFANSDLVKALCTLRPRYIGTASFRAALEEAGLDEDDLDDSAVLVLSALKLASSTWYASLSDERMAELQEAYQAQLPYGFCHARRHWGPVGRFLSEVNAPNDLVTFLMAQAGDHAGLLLRSLSEEQFLKLANHELLGNPRFKISGYVAYWEFMKTSLPTVTADKLVDLANSAPWNHKLLHQLACVLRRRDQDQVALQLPPADGENDHPLVKLFGHEAFQAESLSSQDVILSRLRQALHDNDTWERIIGVVLYGYMDSVGPRELVCYGFFPDRQEITLRVLQGKARTLNLRHTANLRLAIRAYLPEAEARYYRDAVNALHNPELDQRPDDDA